MRRLFLLLALVAIALAAQAPAWLLERDVQERSGRNVELRNASGTVWNGRADVVFGGDGAGSRAVSAGGVTWRVERIDWQRRAIIVDVRQTPPGPRPLTLALGADRVRMTGSARLPATVAGRVPLLAGWRIGGEVVIDSDAFEWAEQTGTGAATVLWRGARLDPPDLPGGFALGELTAQIALDGTATTVSVRNSGGELELSGDASSRTGKVTLLLQPRAGASAAQEAWLHSHTTGRTPRGYVIDTYWPVH